MRQLATIQKIAEVQPIEGAERIEKVRVKDWWCVAKKGEFKADDLCVYFEIDSLLPVSDSRFEFLSGASKPKTMNVDGKEYTGYRLRTVKLRGQLSQGLALPLQTFPEVGTVSLVEWAEIEGKDVSDALGIVKYEAPLPAQLMGKAKGPRPSFIPKTDEERVQNLGDLVQKYQGQEFYISEKLDGSSATFFRAFTNNDGDHFGVCSRNLELKDTDDNTFWQVAKKYDLPNKLPSGYCIQGELVGDGIQGNPLKIQGYDVYFFNVYNMENGNYLDFDEAKAFLESLGVKMVPIVSERFELRGDVQALLDMAEGKSLLTPSADREGIVFRPLTEARDVINGAMARLSFKAISNNYLLAGHD